MYYITVKMSPQYHQMTLEELLFKSDVPFLISENTTSTKTYKRESISPVFTNNISIDSLVSILREHNKKYKELKTCDRESLYKTFYIPKSSGGLRRIDAPNENLMECLRELKTIFENKFHAMYHTSAFAYIKHRSTIDALKRHQKNESKWYAKFDLSNFFGSTTLEYVVKMLEMIFPFSEVLKRDDGREELESAVELAFLNGVLPQGTPLSPLITNIIMIPVDYELCRLMRESGKVYTRYADDFLISSKYQFNFREVEDIIKSILDSFEAPFNLNTKKTRYGSSAGSNWNLGLMINKDNNITVGYKKKKQFKAMLTSYILDTVNGKRWSKQDVQVLDGYRNYYRMIEPKVIDAMVDHIGEKFQVDPVKMIKADIKRREI